ncbi:uncharacterized protein EV154DRAFT_569718 [Mucor mucedo]|uniref:uncharacterized protein n=1 Tax=Mucor mucedo TaxID=29922 RepID=UPI00221F3283|nr:uncharacterized protein EV154DRAFT_569718 [Mucor mucedo]KAI7874434.1 hypothetical protein EV154DRAFT_569718 [Mucor mucedo]
MAPPNSDQVEIIKKPNWRIVERKNFSGVSVVGEDMGNEALSDEEALFVVGDHLTKKAETWFNVVGVKATSWSQVRPNRGRPFGTTNATLIRNHSANQSRMTAFLTNQSNTTASTDNITSVSNTNPEDLIETNVIPENTTATDKEIIPSFLSSRNNNTGRQNTTSTELSESDNVEIREISNDQEQSSSNDFQNATTDVFGEEELLEELDEDMIQKIDRDAGLVQENSVIDKFLKSIQDRIKEDNKKDPLRFPKRPKQYQNGTFWVQRKSPVFALKDQLELTPNVLYQPRVFLWFPHHLVSNLKCPKCSTPTTFFVKEWNTCPRARRITDLDDSFYVMTVKYKCTNDKTPDSFNGYDKGLVQQLPRIYAKEFPAILTESSGISTRLAKLMRPLFQSGVGPQRLSKVLRVIHTEHIDELQFQYYKKMVEKLQNPTMIDCLRKKRDGGSVSYDEISSFGDKQKYAGYIPCANYLSHVYSSLIEEFVLFMDQLTSMTDGIILKGDHSFKIIKHMGKTNGTSVFSSLYTVMNEYEEIRMQVLAHTKSLKELSGSFGSMMESYRRYEFDMPLVFYTDNVAADKNTLEAYIPSLSDNVRAIVIDKSTGDANVSSQDQFPPAVLPESIAIEIRDTAQGIDESCQKILDTIDVDDNSSEIFVGFHSQIYHEESNTIFLFRIFSFDRDTFPGKLKEIIASKRIRKIGKNVGGDLTRLKRYVSETNGELELGTYCFSRNAISSSRKLLSDICNVILKIHLPKSNDVRLSNWEALELSDQQKRYAFWDAYVAIAVYNSVKGMQLVNKYVTKNTPVGTFVVVFPRSASKAVTAAAFGYIADSNDPESHDFSLQNSIFTPLEKTDMALIKFVKVKRPGLILDKYKAANSGCEDRSVTLEMFGDVPFLAYVEYKCLRTASESINLKDIHSETLTESTVPANISFSSSNAPVRLDEHKSTSEKATVPSRVLKDAFHLIEQIPISLRHGMAKDFKRRFRDCLFAVNEEDKKKVEEYVISIGSDRATHLVNNPDFIWERVRRSIPPPNELASLVQDCFDKYANLVCIKTGHPLFDKESILASKRVMDQIEAGYVSDIVDGPPLYTEKGFDKNGLMRYACSRGTSSVEGSCHFNIIRKFSSFNAGPRLTNMALYDYRLFHNINMGSKNRYGIIHKSHYSPWLFQSIDALRSKVGHPMRTDSHFGSSMLESAYLYRHTNEKFGISPIPSHIKNDHLMLPYDPNTHFQSGLPENNPNINAIPIVKLPNMYYGSHQFIYRYLSKCQGTKYAVTAVHTPQEKSLFDLMLDDFNENSKYAYLKSANGIVNFGLMAAAWSKICSSTNFIYYKTPEHLCSYNNILEDRRKYRDTVAHNIVASRSIRLATQSKRRYNTSTAAKKYRRLEPAVDTPNGTITPSSDCLEQTTSTPINIAPRPPNVPPVLNSDVFLYFLIA